VFPHAEARAGIETVLRHLRASGHPPFLAVLKGLGEGRGGLAFPRPGLTIALDLPRRAGLDAVLDRVDEEVAARGGRIYLAKDAGASPERFARMTPELPAFRTALAALDPGRRFHSDLARRLALR
jgi:decaprenylphospho-beta-D-ribofuranose 2-oxidase